MKVERGGATGALALGGSWGGLEAASRLLARLPRTLPVPVFLVLHQRPSPDGRLTAILGRRTELQVIAPEDKDRIDAGCLYVAPPGYHMLVNPDATIGLSLAAPVHYSRPAIDETFFSVGHIYGRGAVGVILTGANEDGAAGIGYIARRGGLTLAQSPAEAEVPLMPEAAIATGRVHQVLELDEMGNFLLERIVGTSRK